MEPVYNLKKQLRMITNELFLIEFNLQNCFAITDTLNLDFYVTMQPQISA